MWRLEQARKKTAATVLWFIPLSRNFSAEGAGVQNKAVDSPPSRPRPSLAERELSETNYGETILITLLLQRGEGTGLLTPAAPPLGARPWYTYSHSPALIVQKMWFVPWLFFLGKVVFAVGGVPAAWIASLFSSSQALSVRACVCVCRVPALPAFSLFVCTFVLKVICTHFVCPSSLNKIFQNVIIHFYGLGETAPRQRGERGKKNEMIRYEYSCIKNQ